MTNICILYLLFKGFLLRAPLKLRLSVTIRVTALVTCDTGPLNLAIMLCTSSVMMKISNTVHLLPTYSQQPMMSFLRRWWTHRNSLRGKPFYFPTVLLWIAVLLTCKDLMFRSKPLGQAWNLLELLSTNPLNLQSMPEKPARAVWRFMLRWIYLK